MTHGVLIRAAVLGLLAILATGCILGQGDGWIRGSLWVDSCADGQPLDRQGDFSLDVDFFAGEPLADPNPSPSQRRNRLALRIQVTSNNIEESDGLVFQILDTEAAARSFVAGTPIPVTNRVSCSGTTCPPNEDLLRARLYLFTRCPDCRQPLVGSSDELGPSTTPGKPCKQPTGKSTPACPTLSAEARAALDLLCAGSFSDPKVQPTIASLLGGGGACVYLCRFGSARVGQDPATLAGFAIEYGDLVAGLFSLRIVDGRALETRTCAVAEGQLTGMISFEVKRGQSAQAFP